MKAKRDPSDPYWKSAEENAKIVSAWPEWKKGARGEMGREVNDITKLTADLRSKLNAAVEPEPGAMCIPLRCEERPEGFMFLLDNEGFIIASEVESIELGAVLAAAVNAITPAAQGGGGLLEHVERLRERVAILDAERASVLEATKRIASTHAAELGRASAMETELRNMRSYCMMTFLGGYREDAEIEIFRHGMATVCNFVDVLLTATPQQPKEHCPRRLMGEELPKHLPCDTGDFSRDGTVTRKTDDPERKAFWKFVHDLAQLREQIPEERRREAMSASNRGVPTFEPVTSAIPGPPMSRADRAIANERIAPSPRVEDDESITCGLRRCSACGWLEQACNRPCPIHHDGLHTLIDCNGTGVQS